LAADAARAGPVEWLGAGPCMALVGERALRRIVANLLGNALRYGEGQPVELRLKCLPDEVRIAVLDRGPGIPEAERETVFQPFYRLEGSRARETGGSGLGLAIVRQLADAYGWRVELSGREGGGLSAELIIPRPPGLAIPQS
jgi:two-component system osmolarity sensor histidine kinase EnvZ